MRHRAHRHERADRQVAGAEVRARRAALQPLGEQRAHLRRARARSCVPPAASATTSSSRRCSSARCQASRGVVRGERVGGRGDRRRPRRRSACGSRSASSVACRRSTQLGEAAGEVDRAALDVVERQHAAEQPLLVLGHRHAEQQPVEPGPPRARRQRVELERRAVLGVEAPADPARRATHSSSRARSSSSKPEAPAHRLAVGEVEHLRGGQPLARRARAAGRRRRAPGWSGAASGRRAGRAGRAGGSSAGSSSASSSLRDLARAERRLDQRRERLDVRAHHDHVARLERRVVGEQVQDRVAQHLDLARAAVAGVDLHAAVVGVEQRARPSRRPAVASRTSAWMRREQRVAAVLDRVVVVGVLVGAASTSCSSRASWPQEASRRLAGSARGRVVARRTTGARPRVAPRPAPTAPATGAAGTGGRRGRSASARSTSRWPAGSRVRPNSDSRCGQVDEPGLVAQPRARALEPLGRAGRADPLAQPPPQLGLPRGVGRACRRRRPARPRADHLGPVQRVAVEQVGEVPDGWRSAARGPRPTPPRCAARLRSHGSPSALVDDLEQRPHRPLRQPRVRVRVDPGGRRDRVADEPARRRELDVGAHAVAAPGRRAEARRQPLRQPALHPARRHGDDLGRERVGERVGQQRAERLDEAVGPFGSVDVEHAAQLTGANDTSAMLAPRLELA